MVAPSGGAWSSARPIISGVTPNRRYASSTISAGTSIVWTTASGGAARAISARRRPRERAELERHGRLHVADDRIDHRPLPVGQLPPMADAHRRLGLQLSHRWPEVRQVLAADRRSTA